MLSSPHDTLRKVVVVAPQFPPCNLAAVHRSRLFVGHLRSFGFEPIVLTVEPAYYEGPLDHELAELVPPSVRIVRTPALSTKPVRLIGDLGIRSFRQHYKALNKLAREEKIALLYIPIPPNYSCLLGPLIKRRYNIPYVIDYIDPWVRPVLNHERFSLKARLSHWLARRLEPMALSKVDGIVGVAEGYFQEVLLRHPNLKGLPRAAIPYGGEKADHDFVQKVKRPSKILDALNTNGKFMIVYAGTMWPKATQTFRTLLEACRIFRARNASKDAKRLHFLFVGTGSRINDAKSGQIAPIAAAVGASDFVTEIAVRQPFVEVLALLDRADAIAIVGSSERHYTASKIFQAMQSMRPILSILHEESTAAEILSKVDGVEQVTFNDSDPVEAKLHEIEESLGALFRYPAKVRVERDTACLDPYSAKSMTEKLANVFRQVLTRHAGLDERVEVESATQPCA